jgi:hypothetical protein
MVRERTSCSRDQQLGMALKSTRLSNTSVRSSTTVPTRLFFEPTPVESGALKAWRLLLHLCDNWLSNRVFASGRQIVDRCCGAWTKLMDQPWTIMACETCHRTNFEWQFRPTAAVLLR